MFRQKTEANLPLLFTLQEHSPYCIITKQNFLFLKNTQISLRSSLKLNRSSYLLVLYFFIIFIFSDRFWANKTPLSIHKLFRTVTNHCLSFRHPSNARLNVRCLELILFPPCPYDCCSFISMLGAVVSSCWMAWQLMIRLYFNPFYPPISPSTWVLWSLVADRLCEGTFLEHYPKTPWLSHCSPPCGTFWSADDCPCSRSSC